MEYTDYSESTQKYMRMVENFIRNKYGKIKKEWSQSLTQIAQLKDICDRCANNIKEQGVATINRYGGIISNPSIKDYTTCMKALLTLQKEFGLTPSALIKIERLEPKDEKSEEETLTDAALALIG